MISSQLGRVCRPKEGTHLSIEINIPPTIDHGPRRNLYTPDLKFLLTGIYHGVVLFQPEGLSSRRGLHRVGSCSIARAGAEAEWSMGSVQAQGSLPQHQYLYAQAAHCRDALTKLRGRERWGRGGARDIAICGSLTAHFNSKNRC